MTYADFYKNSIDNPQAFWDKEAQLIDWKEPYSQVLDYSRPPFTKWFVGGRTNLCHNAVDRWADKQGDKPALIAISTETNTEKVYTFKELQTEVMRAAAMMQSLGV
ncbi:acetyl-coenzyme A synthetase N-terminal domain-containing protein, partial [Noviherbaspirillum sp.]|uniref:acetyl-coenzyme A synthetase N-terminal domain-containing protein n=1 Tax=Noviherbaspirillum sp. TaxID=1926288 RepID=UPI002D63B951